jgi:hypothetical protein
MQEQVAESGPPQASGAVPTSQPQVYSNGTTPEQAPRAASGDLLDDLMGTLAIEAPPSATSTSPRDLLPPEAPLPAPPAAAAASGDSLALALLDEAPTQVQVCLSSLVTCSVTNLVFNFFIFFYLFFACQDLVVRSFSL